MRKIFLLFGFLIIMLPTMAQQYPFKQKWTEVEKLQNQGQTKSLIPLLQEIYLAAKEENQQDDLIKAFILKSNISIQTMDDEDIVVQTRDEILQEIEQSTGTQQSILQTILAQLYLNYYQNNFYRFQNRTDLAENESTDFRTWTTSKFLQEIDVLLQSSLENKTSLLKMDPKEVALLLHQVDEYRFLQPTLYDILARKAINIYNDYRFKTQEFDQDLRKQRIENIFLDLIQIHTSDKDKSAVIQYQIEYLEFLNDNSQDYDIISALKKLDEQYKNELWSTQILASQAHYLRNQNQLKEAVEIAEIAQKRFPNTFGAKRANSIQQEIEYPELYISSDAEFIANQHNPLNITHKNVSKIYYRVYELNNQQFAENPNGFNFNYQGRELNINGNLVLEDSVQLKSFDDYQNKRTHIPFPPIPAGNYVILISENNQFTGEIKHHLSQAAITSTNINFAVRRISENDSIKSQIQFIDKLTGLPFSNQKISLLYSYDKSEFRKIKSLKTDDFGRVVIPMDKQRNYRDAYAIQTPEEKTIFPINSNQYYQRKSEENWTNHLKIFTDRAIYRPGQTVYFKGILYQTKGDRNLVAKNEKVTIILEDANYEEISEIELVSNEFGSVHGEFVLPTSGLTGNFEISDDWSEYDSYSFRVEEYKRPRFEVKLNEINDVYQINDEVKVTGKATTFSGANVADAKVVYRVFRKAYQPYGWWWPPVNTAEVDIISGETMTEENGTFNFDFTALPEENEVMGKRAYHYRIVVDITDITGETRSLEGSVRIGDIPFRLNLTGKEKYSVDEFNKIKISVQNLNGMETDAAGNFEIIEISPLDRILRNQQTNVDYELLDREDFISKLPYIAFNNEHLTENRERGQTILTQDWDSSVSDTIQWNQRIPVGIYELKAISVYKNDTIENTKIVEIFDPNSNKEKNTFFDVSVNQNSFQPGDIAEITFTSDAHSAHVLIELEVHGKILQKDILKLDNFQILKIPILEEHRGGIFVHVYFNKFNESISRNINIHVPHDDKNLEFSVSTLRNKLEPGQNETWTLTLKDKNGDAFLAEVLASMYDKSLDQFKGNPYYFSVFTSNRSQTNTWTVNNLTSFRNMHYRERPAVPYLVFEDLNLFGLSLNESQRYQMFAKDGLIVNSMQESRVEEDSAAPPVALAGEVAGLQLESGQPGAGNSVIVRGINSISEDALYVLDGIIVSKEEALAANALSMTVLEGTSATAIYGSRGANGVIVISTENIENVLNLAEIQARKNLQETAFFFPNLKTDKEGNVKIEFTSPESLTQWNFQAVAHTEDLKTGIFQADIVTQKELMVVPNAPRFLREGDLLTFKAQVMNLSDQDLGGNAQLFLYDAFSMQPIEAKFELTESQQNFSVKSGGNTSLSWNLKIPNVDDVQSVIYRIVASTGEFSDGEENALPILTNRMMVTETMPIHIRENQSKTFILEKLSQTTSETRENFKLTMEMTTNPIWYAVMSLPYLREYPYDSSEQIFARFYGNLISQSIVNSNPKIKAVFDEWNRNDQLVSPLEKNEELKNILLEETPWMRDAQSESEQMKRIAVLFDLNQMRNELQNTYRKLEQKQSHNGGFAWFEGGIENFYITTHIVAGFGHLKAMDIHKNSIIQTDLESIPAKAIQFIDKEMEIRWDKFLSDKNRYSLSGYDGLYWLYARSYFINEHPLSRKLQAARDYFLTEMQKDKFNQNLKTQGLLALTLNRFEHSVIAKELILSLKDRAVVSDEMGMYWKENVSGYNWYQAPVETQALIIEAFDEITPADTESVENMKVWLLKHKQTHQWNSTKATTEAVYALMNTGKDWTNAEKGITVKIGNQDWLSDDVKPSRDVQQGSGYVKSNWVKSEISPEMAKVEIEKTSPGVAWGAMYWQYFEDLDKITKADTNVRFYKQLYIQKNTLQGPQLYEITPETPIEIGDLVKVRLEIQTDRAMEFVHIKDMRASGFEPVNVLSAFKWQDGLGYYESTRDAATNFFIDYLPKGVYVFEYDLRANNAGIFSNGITQLQNMYAPEFTAHSEGLKVEIKE